MTDNNEGMLIELADDFKKRFGEKTKLINELKKFILMLYGIIRIAHEHEDIHFVEIARSELYVCMLFNSLKIFFRQDFQHTYIHTFLLRF